MNQGNQNGICICRTRHFSSRFQSSFPVAAVLVIVLFLTSCATYHPSPITSERVQNSLQPPHLAELRVPASEIDHPLLRPVELNPDEGLTPEGAAVIAVLLNPSLRATRDQRELKTAQLLEAGLLPNPSLSYSLEAPVGGNSAGKVTAFGIGVDWDITSLISNASQKKAAKASREAVCLDVAWNEFQVAKAAETSVYKIANLEKRCNLASRASRLAMRTINRLQQALEEGNTTLDVLTDAQATARQTRYELIALEKNLAEERLHLKRIMGLPSSTEVRLSQKVTLPLLDSLPGSKCLKDRLEQRRLDLVALRRAYDSQEEAVRTAVLEQFPRIGIGPDFSRDTDNVKTIGFGLTVELPFLNHNQGNIAIQRATRQMLFDEYISRVHDIDADIDMIVSAIHFLKQQISATLSSEDELRDTIQKYRSAMADGEIDSRVYIKVRYDLFQTEMKELDLRGQIAQAAVALQLATGFLELPDSSDMCQPGPPQAMEENSQ